ncbi:LOW QUALITY PROTEIN: hypothetical protein GQ55_9G475100 [Panicum hallii var. hallii]|uniref:Uncharacterized protein n=1 Tax=Panicum hallii var. hallii TaxID=1504633 RepID=A0A2T7CCL9_9POAL|nr:LOW QUALITY PROTEIN: hypothetical protein GQ55_9G475100 [Panicum hallii var. hallii]
MTNSISLSGGIPGSSSGKTSGYSFTTGTPSKGLASMLNTIGSNLLSRITCTPSGFVRCTTLSVQPMRPLCRLSQSIPRITSIPPDLSTTKSARNSTPLKLILTHGQPNRQLMSPPGVRVNRGVFSSTVGILCFSTKLEDMNECDAPESNSTVARAELARYSPSITP